MDSIAAEITGLDSMDNEFPLLALEHGVRATGLFALVLLAAVVRLVGSPLRSDMTTVFLIAGWSESCVARSPVSLYKKRGAAALEGLPVRIYA